MQQATSFSLLKHGGLVLALSLTACASAPSSATAQQREALASQYELTADAWERLGSKEQSARYRRLAEQARTAVAPEPPGSGGLIEALAHALFGPGFMGRK